MDRLKMQTVNKADENFQKLTAMFPNAVTETIDENGEVVRAIDKDVLMQEIACFDDNATEAVITETAKQKPYYFILRDSSMANDSVATNFEQIFAVYSPETVRKVL